MLGTSRADNGQESGEGKSERIATDSYERIENLYLVLGCLVSIATDCYVLKKKNIWDYLQCAPIYSRIHLQMTTATKLRVYIRL